MFTRKMWKSVLIAMVLVMFAFASIAEARGRSFSSSRSFSSKSFSSSSSRSSGKSVSRSWGSSFGKSSKKSYSGTKGSGKASKNVFGKRSGGYSKGANSKVAKTKTPTVQTKFASKRKQTMSKFKTKPRTTVAKTAKTYKSNKTISRVNYDRGYYNRRNTYYVGYSMPSYGYYGSPYYGMYDSMFMWMMLDNINSAKYRSTYYHNSNTAEFQQWRTEANKLSGDNAELKAKLAKLDAEMSGMSGAKNAGYIADGIPAEAVISPEVLAEVKKPALRTATASKTGNYQKFGEYLKVEADDTDVTLRNTKGSAENLRLLAAGEVDAIIVQADAIDAFIRTNGGSKVVGKQVRIYPEPVQVIANRNADMDSIKDLDPSRHVLIIGDPSGGTVTTWNSMVRQDSHYGQFQTVMFGSDGIFDYDDALSTVATNPNYVMIYVSGLQSGVLKKAERMAKNGDELMLIAFDDWDFNDAKDINGDAMYEFVTIPTGIYPSLQKSNGMFGSLIGSQDSVETLAVSAIFVVGNDWIKTYGQTALDDVAMAVVEAEPMILRRVGGTK